MLGYALTGSTREHALFFLYGTGANGKSVLLNTISHILDEYHRTAPIETFHGALLYVDDERYAKSECDRLNALSGNPHVRYSIEHESGGRRYKAQPRTQLPD